MIDATSTFLFSPETLHFCKCGCKNIVKSSQAEYCRGHRLRSGEPQFNWKRTGRPRTIPRNVICSCGCGQTVRDIGAHYVLGHYMRRPEMRYNILKVMCPNPTKGKFGKDNPHFGMKRSQQAIKNISKAIKTSFDNGRKVWNEGLTIEDPRVAKYVLSHKGWKPTNEQIKKMLSFAIPNKMEIRLLNILKTIDSTFEFVGNGALILDGKNPDFVNNKKQIVELFGEAWHESSEESLRIETFSKFGYKCIIIWGKELKSRKSVENLKQKLREELKND